MSVIIIFITEPHLTSLGMIFDHFGCNYILGENNLPIHAAKKRKQLQLNDMREHCTHCTFLQSKNCFYLHVANKLNVITVNYNLDTLNNLDDG